MCGLKKIYNPIIFHRSIEKVLIFGMLICVITGIGFKILNLSMEINAVSNILMALGLGLFIISLTFNIMKYARGYSVDCEGIIYRSKFKQYQIKYNDISNIIISNAVIKYHGENPVNMRNRNGQIVACPWVTVIGKGTCSIERKEFTSILTGLDIERLCQKDTPNYGFIWNKDVMGQIFNSYEKRICVAKTVLDNYPEEYGEICNEYDISEQRICILCDK